MATRKPPSRKKTEPPPPEGKTEAGAQPIQEPPSEILSQERKAAAPGSPTVESAAPVEPKAEQEKQDHQPRFHFFIIDTGWKSNAARVIRENFHMIRDFQNDDQVYVLTREQSVALVRANPDLMGKTPLILVHDLHAKGGRGDSGYHGFRLCMGLIKSSEKALLAMQNFLRFMHSHRHSLDIERDIRKALHRQGLEGAIQVIREGAQEMME